MPVFLMVDQLVRPFSSPHLRGETELRINTSEELKAAFLQAFQVLKKVSMEERGVDITSSYVLFPTFLEHVAHHAISEAAHEAGLFPYQMWTPHQMISMYNHILDESPSGDPLEKSWGTQPTLIIDYGLSYFDVQMRGVPYEKNKFTMDTMGGQYIVQHIMRKIISSGQDIPEELAENGAAQEKMFWAVANSRLRIKEQIGHETWESLEDGAQIKEWPVTIKGRGDVEDVAVISWDYVKDAEAAYVEWLREFLTLLIERLKASYSESIKKDRSLVSRAVRESFGAEVGIIGGNDERDITLEAQGGARIAWSVYERTQRANEDVCEDFVHEDL
ncbi:hypothetical protein N7495_000803 [Penicillium taxi]|uniref:uncharacterized protein n=1 Tax=Penicillium taxi TaxID=168475 RepID=UPI002545A885|nr:uncharacterized protein N7495_000803 [Penicillium taxi]KAJ5908121.1 hypothetical protein N7495_000803 [Penicillium taxi]